MKKLIVAILVICLLFGGVITYVNRDRIALFNKTDAVAAESSSGMDFDRLYKLHSPDMVIMTVNGTDVCWGDYCYYLYRYCSNAESLMATYAMYGMDLGWDTPFDESGITLAEYLPRAAEDMLVQAQVIMDTADEYGVELSEDSMSVLEAGLKQDIASLCGEGADEEEFYKALEKQYMSRELYEYNRRLSCYNADTFALLYGENASEVKDEDAVKYLEDNGYMTAGHILFLTSGADTDEAAKSEKLKKAAEVSRELKAIKDNEERKARFLELKAELCEDGGRFAYPVAYVFQSGTMVPEFESTVKELGDYEVSEPVETDYGYHVIIRLPHDPELPVYSSSGDGGNARQAFASDAFTAILDGKVASSVVEYTNGFTHPELMKFVK